MEIHVGVEVSHISEASQRQCGRRRMHRRIGWTVVDHHVYSDDAVSGAETQKLVNRQRLLQAIAVGRPPFQVLVMRDASRLSRRDGVEAFGELKRLAQAGIEIYLYAEPPASPPLRAELVQHVAARAVHDGDVSGTETATGKRSPGLTIPRPRLVIRAPAAVFMPSGPLRGKR
jgi:hypothetical protein